MCLRAGFKCLANAATSAGSAISVPVRSASTFVPPIAPGFTSITVAPAFAGAAKRRGRVDRKRRAAGRSPHRPPPMRAPHLPMRRPERLTEPHDVRRSLPPHECAMRARSSGASSGSRCAQPVQRAVRRSPCNSTTLRVPARVCKPSTFCVARKKRGTMRSRSASARCPAFGSAARYDATRSLYHVQQTRDRSQTRRGSPAVQRAFRANSRRRCETSSGRRRRPDPRRSTRIPAAHPAVPLPHRRRLGRPSRKCWLPGPNSLAVPELPDIAAYISALEPRIVGQPLERVRIASVFLLRHCRSADCKRRRPGRARAAARSASALRSASTASCGSCCT